MDNGHNLKLSAAELDAALARAQNISNPNLLDNWYFANPVNQRGQMNYRGQDSYSIDRWILQYDTNLELVGDAVRLSGSWDMKQILERSLPNGTYTASVLYKDGEFANAVNDFSLFLDNSAGESVYGSHTKETAGLLSCTFTVSGNDINRVRFAMQDDSGNSKVDILAGKLELGSQQTLAHQDENGNWVLNEIPNYAEELAKCQRYYVDSRCGGTGGEGAYVSTASADNFLFANVRFPVPMRVRPTVKIYSFSSKENDVSFWASGSDAGLTTATVNTATLNQQGFNAVLGTYVVNQTYAFHYVADANL